MISFAATLSRETTTPTKIIRMNTQTCVGAPPRARRAFVRTSIHAFTSCLLGAMLLAGCAKTNVTKDRLVYEYLPKPNHIYVYDFSSSPGDIAKDSAIAGSVPAVAATPEQVAIG